MLPKLFSSIETTILSRFKEAEFLKHQGDKGENREHILREFLEKHLPKKYGITKGEIITKDGKRSHSADIIIYDALGCPILYSERTSIVPIEGVYGIIEVKSSLSKTEFIDAAGKIKSFKELAPRDLGIIQTREYLTLHRPSRPFGIVFGFNLAGNSLNSLSENFTQFNNEIYNVNYFTNFFCVLGEGLVFYEKCDLSIGEKNILIDTDEFVDLVQAAKKGEELSKESLIFIRPAVYDIKDQVFGRFFVFLLILLSKMKLNQPDLGQYIDADIPMTVSRES